MNATQCIRCMMTKQASRAAGADVIRQFPPGASATPPNAAGPSDAMCRPVFRRKRGQTGRGEAIRYAAAPDWPGKPPLGLVSWKLVAAGDGNRAEARAPGPKIPSQLRSGRQGSGAGKNPKEAALTSICPETSELVRGVDRGPLEEVPAPAACPGSCSSFFKISSSALPCAICGCSIWWGWPLRRRRHESHVRATHAPTHRDAAAAEGASGTQPTAQMECSAVIVGRDRRRGAYKP